MVALLSPTRPSPTRPSPTRPSRLGPTRGSATQNPRRLESAAAVGVPSCRPRHLQLVESKATTSADPLSIAAVTAIIAMILLVVLVRGVQGAPPASDWEGLTSAANASANPAVVADTSVGESGTVVVVDGDTWASIAARVAPGVDPIDFARLGASMNGGYQLEVGDVLVVPAVD